MLKSLILVSGLTVATVAGVTAIDTQAADDGPAAVGVRGRWAHTPLGKLISGRIGRAMVLRSELDITAEQRQQIRSILMSHRKEIAKAVQPVVEQRRDLRDAVLAKKPDEKKIRAASDALGKSIGDAAVTMSKVAGELRGVLTDEQVEKVKEFHADNATAVDGFFEKVLGE